MDEVRFYRNNRQKKREEFDCRLKDKFPLLFGRGYEDVDTLCQEVYLHFKGKEESN